MDLESLERRIKQIEDLEAIKQLKARYCEICDDAHDPDRITGIFTEDGVWEGKGIGHAKGHAEIRALFQGFQKSIAYSQHMVMNPILEVDGETACGVWYFFGAFTFRERGARWLAARYHEEYAKVHGTWKIRHLRIGGPVMNAPYERGWAPRES